MAENGSNIASSLILTGIILLGILITFLSTGLLSKTILKGMPSAYTLEMPPYRKPRPLEVLIRSVFDRTLFVLGRAITVAVPAGIIIWLCANINLDGKTNIVDLVRLKKITVGIEDETLPADMDADGDILATDVVLLKKHLIKK